MAVYDGGMGTPIVGRTPQACKVLRAPGAPKEGVPPPILSERLPKHPVIPYA